MTAVDLIISPYDSGRRNWRCGLGPAHILQAGAEARLGAAGAVVRLTEIETTVGYESETDLVFEAQRQIAQKVAAARAADRFPVVLGGNCNTAIGGVSGLGGPPPGLIWFDAHGDFCTPETTDSGFLDGMGLAMMVGRCWRTVLETVPGYGPVAETATAIVGARDLDPWEVRDLQASAITEFGVAGIRETGVEASFTPFLDRLADTVASVYLQIDLDVHDPQEAPANYYNAPDGLAAHEVRDAIALIGARLPIAGAGLSSYDPAYDPQGATAAVAVGVLESLIAAVQQG